MYFDSRYRKFGLIVSDECECTTETRDSAIKNTKIFSILGYKVLNIETLSFEDVYIGDEDIEFEAFHLGSRYYDSLIDVDVTDGSYKNSYFHLKRGYSKESVTSPLPVYKKNGTFYKSYKSNKVLYKLGSLYAVVVDAKSLSIDIILRFKDTRRYNKAINKYSNNYFGGYNIGIEDKIAILEKISDGIYGDKDLCCITNETGHEVIIPSSCKYIWFESLGEVDTIVFGKRVELFECKNTKLALASVKNIYISKKASKEFIGCYLYSMVIVFYGLGVATDLVKTLRHELFRNRECGYAVAYDICNKEKYKDAIEYVLQGTEIIVY